tara:strand:+ start:12229 stop:13080 length:852 start_codon:yes stop_codon:yes gene_type:complete
MSKTSEVRKQGLDKFYTIPSYSKELINIVCEKYNILNFDAIIEPSAGNGSFCNHISHSNVIGIDICPEHPNILGQDFLEYYYPNKSNNNLVIGNPPFGKNSSLAIKFFNHAATMSNIIAFIIPRTFRKDSIKNKLDRNFHLVLDIDVPTNPCCFEPKMMAKCCFQIWEKSENAREIIKLPTIHNDWQFMKMGELDSNNQPTPPDGADFAIRAYGGSIGQIEISNLMDLRPKSWHWIKSNIDINILMQRFRSLNYENSKNTARQNSMGRSELVQLYSLSYSNIT